MIEKNIYNKIHKEFSQSRKYKWEEFEIFYEEVSKIKNPKILDVGCGNGRLLKFLLEKNFKFSYKGVDFSEKMLEEAKKHHKNFDFSHGNMKNFSFDENFDFIFSIASFHHLQTKKERYETLNNFSKHLKKNGKIFMTNWNLFQKKYFKCFFKNFFQKKAWNDTFVPFISGGKNLGNRFYHAFTLFELGNLFKKNGLKIVKKFKKGFNFCHILGKNE